MDSYSYKTQVLEHLHQRQVQSKKISHWRHGWSVPISCSNGGTNMLELSIYTLKHLGCHFPIQETFSMLDFVQMSIIYLVYHYMRRFSESQSLGEGMSFEFENVDIISQVTQLLSFANNIKYHCNGVCKIINDISLAVHCPSKPDAPRFNPSKVTIFCMCVHNEYTNIFIYSIYVSFYAFARHLNDIVW